MECNEDSQNSHEFILGDRPEEDEFISPDLETVIKSEDDIVIKEEPHNPDDDIWIRLDEDDVKEEPQSPDNKTENADDAEILEYGFSITSTDNDNSGDNSGPYILGSIHPNDISTIQGCSSSSTEMCGVKRTPDLVSVNRDAANTTETILMSDIQQRLPSSSGTESNFRSLNQDVHILAFLAGPPPPLVDDQDLEEEVQVQVSNKWIESRGDNYVNLSILSGFPNPQVTKSISLTREGIQIFIHKLPLQTSHSIWNLLGSSTAIEKGQSLSTIANLVEKMKICTGCWDLKCRGIWEEGVFGERGFVEVGFSPSPVYRTFSCDLLIDSESRADACRTCRSEWTNMIRLINKKRRKINEPPRDLDKINYKFLTKVDMENALRESRKEASKYRKQITMLHKEIDGLLGEERHRGNKFCNDEIIIINDKFV